MGLEASGSAGLAGFIVTVVVLGAVGIAGVWLMNLWGKRRRSRDHDPLEVQKIVSLDCGPPEAIGRVVAAMRAAGVREPIVDSERSVVSGTQGPTVRSWGQVLEVGVESVAEGSRLVCTTWPSWDWTFVDWGAGRKLLEAFSSALEGSDRTSAA